MSQQAVRAKAREIRRAFGPAAVAHFDAMEAEIVKVNAHILSLRAEVEDLRQRLRELDQRTLSMAAE